jgi:arylsulfatase A-like enzyme
MFVIRSLSTTKMRHLISAIAVLTPALLAGGCASIPVASAPRPPNIVFIMADDLGYGDLGAYGQQKIRTPHLDEMAREGTRFTQFYAGSPVCAPSRSALMTGQHTGHTPIRGNKEVLPIGQAPLPDSVITLAEVLQRRGYATGAFGKWGLGGPDSEGLPTRQGFDEFFGYLDQRRAHFYYPEFLFRGEERVRLPNRVRDAPNHPGAGPALVRGLYSHDAIADEALDFIERHRSEPFFLYVPFTIPHAELQAPDSAMQPYLDANGRSIFPERPFAESGYGAQAMPHAAYAAMVTRMDRDVGRILDKLRELGLDENTLVIFTSDNGPSVEGGSDPEFFDSNGPFRGVKRDVYEGGIRAPMIARWPGRVPAGRVSDQVWAMWDVLPTLANLANAQAPQGLDGLDMAAALTSEGTVPEHDFLYWEFHEQGGKQAVRKGNWKAVRLDLIKNPRAPLALYDLATDPGEARDVAAQHPDIVREMHAIMVREHTDSNAFPALDALR